MRRKPFYRTRRFWGALGYGIVQVLELGGLLAPGTIVQGLELLTGGTAVVGAIRATERMAFRRS